MHRLFLTKELQEERVFHDFNNVSEENALHAILEALGFDPYITGGYAESSDTRVYVESMNTLRIASNGALDYYADPAEIAAAELPDAAQQRKLRLNGRRAALTDDGTVEQRIVTVLEPFEGWCPVTKGVKEGEKVVISGVSKLRPGAKVALVEATDNDDLNPKYKAPIEN